MESYVERWQREKMAAGKVTKDEVTKNVEIENEERGPVNHGKNTRSKGQETKKETRRRS